MARTSEREPGTRRYPRREGTHASVPIDPSFFPDDVIDDGEIDRPRTETPNAHGEIELLCVVEVLASEAEVPGRRCFLDIDELREFDLRGLFDPETSSGAARRCCVSDALYAATLDPLEILERREEEPRYEGEDGESDDVGQEMLSPEVERLLARIFEGGAPDTFDCDLPKSIPIRRPVVLRSVKKTVSGRKVIKKKYDPREFGERLAKEREHEREHRSREPERHACRDTIRGAAVEIVVVMYREGKKKRKKYTIFSTPRKQR